MEKYCVTGGSGFLGEAFVFELLKKNKTVVNFDIIQNENHPQDCEMFKGDIRNLNSVMKAFEGVDVVIHCVAQVPLAKDKELFWSVNHLGTENMLKAALAQKVKKVIYISSSAVFGVPDVNPVTESTQPKPGEAYGAAKLAGEELCLKYNQDYGLDVSVVRPRTIMGLGRLGIFQILFEWIYNGHPVPVFNGGSNIYQFVHALDLVSASLLASEEKGSQIYNCGAEIFGSMKQVLSELCTYAKTGSTVVSVPMEPAVCMMNISSKIGVSPLGSYHSLMYGRSMYFDVSKLKTRLHWQAKYSNIEMFIESYNWYIKNREQILHSKNVSSKHKSSVKQGVLSLAKYGLYLFPKAKSNPLDSKGLS